MGIRSRFPVGKHSMSPMNNLRQGRVGSLGFAKDWTGLAGCGGQGTVSSRVIFKHLHLMEGGKTGGRKIKGYKKGKGDG